MGVKVYRYQDEEGRGPYRPGMQRQWMDADHDQRNPTFVDEFGLAVVDCIPKRLKHLGCAFISLEQASSWFSAAERQRIEALGYRFVAIEADLVAARSANQVVIACRKPLAELAQPTP